MIEDLCGSTIDGKYLVMSLAGSGGSGTVYRAKQLDLNREVALKILHHSSIADTDSRARFEREAKVLAALDHKNIVRVFQIGLLPCDSPYMAMEFLQGSPLSELISESNGLEWRRAVAISIEVCEALEYAHQRGVVHRDLKPQNVILQANPDSTLVKVVDFGLSKLSTDSEISDQRLTQTGALVGSVQYMSPEMCSGSPVDQRSDIYSMGCMMYECIAGHPPFEYENPIGMLHKHINDPPPPMPDRGQPKALERIILKALAKAPEQRFQSMTEMKIVLEDLMQGKLSETTVSKMPLPADSTTKSRLKPIYLGIALITLAGVGTFAALQYNKTKLVSRVLDSPEKSTEVYEGWKRANRYTQEAEVAFNAGDSSRAQTLASMAVRILAKLRHGNDLNRASAYADVELIKRLSPIFSIGKEESKDLLRGLKTENISDNCTKPFLGDPKGTPADIDRYPGFKTALAVMQSYSGDTISASNIFRTQIDEALHRGNISAAEDCLEKFKLFATQDPTGQFRYRVSECCFLAARGELRPARNKIDALKPELASNGTWDDFGPLFTAAEKTGDYSLLKEILEMSIQFERNASSPNSVAKLPLLKNPPGMSFDRQYKVHLEALLWRLRTNRYRVDNKKDRSLLENYIKQTEDEYRSYFKTEPPAK